MALDKILIRCETLPLLWAISWLPAITSKLEFKTSLPPISGNLVSEGN